MRTVSRRGYILDGGTDTGARIGSQPIVAVLRMRNETGDSEKVWLADGFSEDLINGLARFGTVTVLARNASFSVEDGSRDDHTAAAKRLGAGYLITGAIRRLSEGLRISVALIDATTQRHLWGEHYENADSSVFAIQQDIVDRVIGRLAARLDLDSSRLHVARINASGIDFSPVRYARYGVCFEDAADTRHLCEGVFLALGVPIG